MEYEPFSVTNADVELPMVDSGSATGLSDVRMVDRDMVLVRKGHAASEMLAGNFSTNLSLEIANVNVDFTRGFLIVDVEIEGRGFRFVNTHLEVRGAEDSVFRIIQDNQMLELKGLLNHYADLDPKPVFMVGDFNSSPEDTPGIGYHPYFDMWISYVPPYMQAVDAGYLDAWRLQKRNNEVYTSGFDEYVSDRTAKLTSRIDLIFVDRDDFFNHVECIVVGNKVPDMIPNPAAPRFLRLWPSDHAGVVAKFVLND
jgi:endonuclease/exonuclease/phosphatase family metal-dependent hydrolase